MMTNRFLQADRLKEKIDFYKRKHIKCEGQLAYLNDSIQRPAEYHDATVRGYLETLIRNHNSQVDKSKQFEVGNDSYGQ